VARLQTKFEFGSNPGSSFVAKTIEQYWNMTSHPYLETLESIATPFRARSTPDSTDGSPFILRTRSAEDTMKTRRLDQRRHDDDQDEQELDLSAAVTSLNSSFDAALLGAENAQIFRSDLPPRVSLASSWDESSSPRSQFNEGCLSGLKLLPRNAESTEVIPPSTVRKQQTRKLRSSSLPESVQTPGRPVRPPGSVMRLPRQRTPSSSRRRKASPLQLRQSKSPRPSTLQQQQQQHGQPTSTPRPYFPRGDTPNMLKHPSSPQFHDTQTPGISGQSIIELKQLQQTGNTAITANTSALDVTVDTEGSQESPVSTPFRFTSFPASLPRVHPRPSDMTTPFGFTTTRKKVSYQSRLDSTLEQPALHRHHEDEDAAALKRSRPMTAVMRYNFDEAAAQNSSISSMSGELASSIPQTVAPFPPADLEWKSPDIAKNCTRIDSKYSEDSDLPDPRPVVKSHTLPDGLFLNASNNAYSYSDDDSPVRVNVPRTRLDFNLVLSPTIDNPEEGGTHLDDFDNTNKHFDLSKPYSNRRVRSHVSNASTMTSQQTSATQSTATLTTMSPTRADRTSSMLERPTSPAEVQFRFRLDAAQCSPILPPGRMISDMDMDHTSPQEQLSPVAECKTTASTRQNSSEDDSKLSISHDSSGSSSSKQRSLRPMPDMSAFDTAASVRSGSSYSKTHRNSTQIKKSGDDTAPSPKLACPPTPVRTPAWAQKDGTDNPFFRVLATCPIQVVDGHSSLENSMDMSTAGDIEKRRASLSFSTVVDEERVDEVMEDAEGPRNLFDDTAHDITPPPRSIGTAISIPKFSLSTEPLREVSLNPKTPFAARVFPMKPSAVKATDDVASISFATSFENLGELGSGAFGDVYKVRSKADNQLYAVKRNRRQFRGKRDRDMAMTEVRTMQKLQSVCANGSNKAKSSYSLYLLFFYRAWQEEGFFYCQTELCCRDTCRELIDSLRSKWPSAVIKYPSLTKHLKFNQPPNQKNMPMGRLMPDMTVWKICHDVTAGLAHIHGHGVVHHDIKPSNIFFVHHARLGAMCKIGDFGMAGEIGTSEDGQEGDTVYMPPELLSSSVKEPSADIFSLGLTLYELASDIGWQIPVEGPRWHEVRGGSHVPELPTSRHVDLGRLIQAAIASDQTKRPSADEILNGFILVKEAGSRCDEFLRDYLLDIERNDREQEEREALLAQPEQTPRNMDQRALRTPTPSLPLAPCLFTPNP
jgi:membrane-associated tyrosine- and threonine-specific cdc2-inhibitory kinase